MDSYLSKYIRFGMGYDPFLLVPYERIQKRGLDDSVPKCVQKLFKMNISYVYRLIKVKHDVVRSLSCENDEPEVQLSTKIKEKGKRVRTTNDEEEKQSPYFNRKNGNSY
jgi:hypothetical protein